MQQAPTSQPTFRPSNSLEPLKIITNELAENLGLGGGGGGSSLRRGHPHHDSGYISPNLPPGKGFFEHQNPPPPPPPTQQPQPTPEPHHHAQQSRVDPLLLQQVLQRPKHQQQMINHRPITGVRNHHHRQHHHHPGPHQVRAYHPKNYYDPHYEMCSLLPPPEYLRNMPPPIHNPSPVPNLPCLDPYANGENNTGMIRGYYPHLPPHWRPAVPPPPPPPPHMFRPGGRPPIHPPNMVMNSHGSRHFRSGNSTELHNK